MSHEEGDWVRQGTPRDADAEWNDEQSEYGTAVSPVEWDDYSSEQAVPVSPPQPRGPVGDGPVTPVAPARADEEYVEVDYAPEDADGPFEVPADQAVLSTPADVADDDYPASEPTADDTAAAPEPADEPVVTEPSYVEEPLVVTHPDGEQELVHADEDSPGLVPEPAAQPSPDPIDAPLFDVTKAMPGVSAEDVGEEPVEAVDPVAPDAAPADDAAEVERALDALEADDPDATRVAPALVDVPDEEAALDSPTEQEAAVVEGHDPDATQYVPVADGGPGAAAAAAGGAGAAAAAAAAVVPDDVYRTGETAVIRDTDSRPGWDDEAEAEERRLADQLAAERRARDERLGVVPTSAENETRPATGPAKVTTDRFLPSLSLFGMRLVTAFLLGVAGYNVLTSIDATTELFTTRLAFVPEPRLVAWILGFTLAGMALFLVIGLLQRVVGLLLLALSVCSLAFLRWGAFNPFENQELISGDRALLLAAIGLVLLGLGGGLWGIDGAFRRGRAKAKAEKQG